MSEIVEATEYAEQLDQQLHPVEAQILAWHINTPQDLEHGAKLLQWASSCERDNEGKRKGLKAPALETCRRIDALFMPTTRRLQRIKQHISTEMATYQQRHREEQAKALAEARSREEVDRAVAVLVVAPEGTHERVSWGDFEVEDASLIPDDYWVLDEARIRAELRASKGRTKIPGIKALSKVTTVARGR